MKTNNTKKNSATKKLIPAVSMLTVSAMMLSTATYAWFTMNKTVQVTGMEMKTAVSGNLLICDDNTEAHYASTTLNQTRQALLEPVSTVTATNGKFYYTLDASADGHKTNSTLTGEGGDPYIAYAEDDALTAADTFAAKGSLYDEAFNVAYSIGTKNPTTAAAYKNAYGYVDYTFFIKATADKVTADPQPINMTRCNLIKTTNGTDEVLGSTNKAWRIAVFAEEETTNKGNGVTTTAVTEDTDAAKSILKIEGASEFDSKTVASPTTLGTPTYGSDAVIGSVSNGETKYFKVVVRVWLEGQDTTCYSANYSLLTELYSLDLAFELGKGTAVKNIGSSIAEWTASASPAVTP